MHHYLRQLQNQFFELNTSNEQLVIKYKALEVEAAIASVH